jgi:hypothetical protein
MIGHLIEILLAAPEADVSEHPSPACELCKAALEIATQALSPTPTEG